MAKITGGRSVYMREGSLLNTSCTIQGQVTMVVLIIIMINNMISTITMLQVKAAQEILWYRDKHLLNSSGRGGISITTDKVMIMLMTIMTMMMTKTMTMMLLIIFLEI